MPRLIDLTGQRFGRLIAVRYLGRSRWSCACDCGRTHDIRAEHLRSGATSSCGCIVRENAAILGAAAKAKALPLRVRFWKFVAKSTSENGCWEWAGKKTHDHYGQIRPGGKKSSHVMAHRVSWELHFGSIPADMLVCHRCDNPPCVRPDHLFLGTHQDNVLDAIEKGRWPQILPKHLRPTKANPADEIEVEQFESAMAPVGVT